MKKFFALFLCIAMVLSIAGCGKKDSTDTGNQSAVTENKETTKSDKGTSTQAESSDAQKTEDASSLEDISLTLTSYTDSVVLFDTPEFTMTLVECFTINDVPSNGRETHISQIYVDFENKTDRAIMITDSKNLIINGEGVKSSGFLGAAPGFHDIDTLITARYEEEAPLVIDLEDDFKVSFCEMTNEGDGSTSWDSTDQIGTFHLSLHYDVPFEETVGMPDDTKPIEASADQPDNLISDVTEQTSTIVIIDRYEFDLLNIMDVKAFPVIYESSNDWNPTFIIDGNDYSDTPGLDVGYDEDTGTYFAIAHYPDCPIYVSIDGWVLGSVMDNDIKDFLIRSDADYTAYEDGSESFYFSHYADDYIFYLDIVLEDDIITTIQLMYFVQ